MRVVLATYGSRGDVEPMTALAVRLREHGVEVRACVPPDFVPMLEGLGVPSVPAGMPVQALAAGAAAGTGRRLPEIIGELAAGFHDAVVEASGDGCAAVVATGSLPAKAGARAGAETRGVPYVAAVLSTCYLPSPHHPPVPWPGQAAPDGTTDNRELWRRNAEHLHAVFGDAIDAHRASVGLPPAGSVGDLVTTDHPFLATDPVLGPWPRPADLEATQTGAWIRPDTRPLPDDLAAFLDAGAPPVYVGFGSMSPRDAGAVARAVVDAVRAHGRRLVLGSGWAGLARPDDGPDVALVGEVNQQALFRRVAAVVHHGGAGTTTTAARAGAPQVVVPQVADQPYWAGRVAALGIGAAHEGPTPTVESLSAALDAVLTPDVAARATAVSGTIRTDGAERAATLLLSGIRRGTLGRETSAASTTGGRTR